MARRYDENEGRPESLRDIKMPEVKEMGQQDGYYYSKGDWDGSMRYMAEKDRIADSDKKKLMSHKAK